jgi:hypothetical protein
MLLDGHRLARKQAAPEGVALVPHVHGGNVASSWLVRVKKALARRERLHRLRQGRDVEQTALLGDERAAALP